ncbi:zinc finger FYVE domain-containing protein 21 [Biomphalaria pfeifferi]|uniref:Zinc finger FYVE domain-containing protein 21 n=1 Tax=Biomphalaria pfeifferi TaxID=112525 RepID=A0AAD8BQL0_BIOPF|nr:zinc finger FYVE domain-containing protein 21 [Biomphalaria pfeifferi]
MATSDKRLVKSKSGMRMLCFDPRLASPFTVEEPPWSEEAAHCENVECKAKFDILNRKHHCRRCGKCLCNNCCNSQIILPRMSFIDPVRHCKSCYTITKKENEFFDKHLKTLITGGHFRMHGDDNTELLTTNAFTCSLSPDHRYLQFEGDLEILDKIYINKIESVQIASATIDSQGNRVASGIAIRYINASGNSVLLKMEVEKGTFCNQSMSWITAMHKAFTLISDSSKTGAT